MSIEKFMNQPCRLAASGRSTGAGCRQRGSAIVELALVLPLFLLLLFGVIDLGLSFWANLSMQHAVREGARYAVTGRNDLDPNASDQQRYRAILAQIKFSSMGVFDKVSPVISVNNTSYSSSASYNAGMFGGPGDIVVLKIDCAWPLATPLLRPFFSDGKFHFSVAATVRNEAFK